MHYNSGYAGEALPLARPLRRGVPRRGIVCAPSASCVAMIGRAYPKLAAETADASADPRRRRDRLGCSSSPGTARRQTAALPTSAQSYPRAVTYHSSCHGLRSLQLRDQPRRLLDGGARPHPRQSAAGRRVAGLRRGRSPSRTPASRPPCSTTKSAAILETGAAACVTADNSCLMRNRRRARSVAAPPSAACTSLKCWLRPGAEAADDPRRASPARLHRFLMRPGRRSATPSCAATSVMRRT